MDASDERITQFDGIRGLAFLAVFMHHAVKMPLGWMGVDMFFVLSGFLITRVLLCLRSQSPATALRRFYFRRAVRIIPPYYIALTLIYLACPWLRAGSPWFYGFASNLLDGLGPSLLGVSRDLGGGPLRAMWSIALEAQFYLLWPWLVLFLPRRVLSGVFAGLLLAAPLFRVLWQGVDREAVYRLLPCRMDLLAAGALVANVAETYPRWIAACRRPAAMVAVLSATLFASLTVLDGQFRSVNNNTLFNVVGYTLSTVMFTAVLVYVRVAEDGAVSLLLRLPPLRYVGQISYMAYLVHLYFLDTFSDRWGFGRGVAAPLGLLATLLFSSATWFGVERPLLRLRLRADRVAS